MQRFFSKSSIVFFVALFTVCGVHSAFFSLKQFQQQCAVLPQFEREPYLLRSAVSFDELCAQIKMFQQFQVQQLAASKLWHGIPYTEKELTAGPDVFRPFVHKLVVPHGSTVALFGDLHGNIHALLNALQKLHANGFIDDQLRIDPASDFYMLFLGDYVDRGWYGAEVIYLLMRLKNANPERVFLVRGNHEDAQLNVFFGFGRELVKKYPDKQQELSKLYSLYDVMPVALYLGANQGDVTNYIQCCHGGMEIGFSPSGLLDADDAVVFQRCDFLDRARYVKQLQPAEQQKILARCGQHECSSQKCTSPMDPYNCGFMWSDFMVDNGHGCIDYTLGRGWRYGKPLTQKLLVLGSTQKSKLVGVFRAHQHNGDMIPLLQKGRGIAPLWGGLVHTFITANNLIGVPGSDQDAAFFGLFTFGSAGLQRALAHSDTL
jgi:hypothetical protein